QTENIGILFLCVQIMPYLNTQKSPRGLSMRALFFTICSCPEGCLTIATFSNQMTGDYSPVAVSLLLTL
ncbi:TPA: hypothetical protein ACIBWV_002560, partial [Salmonella enterica subsp. enterica serovar Hvittingfoss]